MLITLERSGGFAGISKIIEVDTAKLPQKQSEELTILFETAYFFNLSVYIVADSNQRDGFQYTLIVKDKNKQNTVTVSESAIPDNLKPLMEWITCNGK